MKLPSADGDEPPPSPPQVVNAAVSLDGAGEGSNRSENVHLHDEAPAPAADPEGSEWTMVDDVGDVLVADVHQNGSSSRATRLELVLMEVRARARARANVVAIRQLNSANSGLASTASVDAVPSVRMGHGEIRSQLMTNVWAEDGEDGEVGSGSEVSEGTPESSEDEFEIV